jgi:hypothetical protein
VFCFRILIRDKFQLRTDVTQSFENASTPACRQAGGTTSKVILSKAGNSRMPRLPPLSIYMAGCRHVIKVLAAEGFPYVLMMCLAQHD